MLRDARLQFPTLDRPLSIIRVGFGRDSVFFEPFAVVPHTNWRGLNDAGTFADGRVEFGSGDHRVEIDWPARDLRAYLRHRPRQEVPSWFGSLIREQQDASGMLYRRNRYYDPVSGRFTQEDPIGLAGGLNLYGFADGDPVTYDDPFGLCPTCDKWALGLATRGMVQGGMAGGAKVLVGVGISTGLEFCGPGCPRHGHGSGSDTARAGPAVAEPR